MKIKKNVAILLSLTSVLMLLVFLWWHWRLGMTRYFDVDEFAHLSWAYQMFSGRRPYIDFLFYIPPGFQVFLMPLFLLGGGVTPILAGRLVQFVLFVVLVEVTMLLFWIMRRSWVAILAGVILAFLPLPFDKFLEIRPDTLAMIFAMLGMVFQIKKKWAVAGVCYGISLLIFPKVLPQVGVAIAVALFTKNVRPLLGGFVIPLSVFGLWALTLGNLDQVIYSLTKLPVEALKISQTFIMMPDLFFYPNTIFYGAPGWSTGLIVNHAIWILAIVVGAYRLVTPGKSWSEFLIASTFFIHIFFYIQIVPLKHTQYLIPIAVYVAFYAADAVNLLWQKAKRNFITITTFIIVITVIEINFYRIFLSVNMPKLAWTNADTIRDMTTLFRMVPTSEYILDLTGQTIYYKHPFVACCIHFGQSAPYMTRPLPSLGEALEKTSTKYIFEGGLKRTNTLLSIDQAYIVAHYLPHPAIGGLLVRR